MRIRIRWVAGEVAAELLSTPSAEALARLLPLEARARTWGDEVYFEVPLNAEKEDDARSIVDPGTVCFWVEGGALALPFGPTPASKDGECRLAARCNVLGRVIGDPQRLRSVREGDRIRVDAAGPD